jgi:hypothetical protein
MKNNLGDEMKKITAIIIIIVALLSIFLIFSYNNTETNQENQIKHLVYNYQDTYVGDNSSVSGILNDIFLAENIKSFKLGTSDAPYSITVNYALEEGINNGKLTQYMEYNATTLFALVNNVEIITLNVNDTIQKTYAFKRETIQTNYDQELSSYITDEKTWMDKVYLNIIK